LVDFTLGIYLTFLVSAVIPVGEVENVYKYKRRRREREDKAGFFERQMDTSHYRECLSKTKGYLVIHHWDVNISLRSKNPHVS